MKKKPDQSGNILFCGVGGQGILLASEITAHALIAAGYDVNKSEVHGMAQRGGAVTAHLRYGVRVFSPLIEEGTADVALSFEKMEICRYLPMLRKEARVIVNLQEILPPSVATGKAPYPANVLVELAKMGIAVKEVDGDKIAAAVGEPRSANIALVGALSAFLPVSEAIFLKTLTAKLPRKFEENRKAFELGRAAMA